MGWNRSKLAAFTAAATLLVGGALPQAAGAQAQPACTYSLGFATLAAALPDLVGSCLENEYFNGLNENSEQRTTGGLLYWRKADNTTAFTDGSRTWLNGPNGLQDRLNTDPPFDWEQPGVMAPAPSQSPVATSPAPVLAPGPAPVLAPAPALASAAPAAQPAPALPASPVLATPPAAPAAPAPSLVPVNNGPPNLRGANLVGADRHGQDLSGADLYQARMTNGDFTGVNFTGATLVLAQADKSTLAGAILTRTHARGASFTNADLRNADFREADLSQANLRGADLRGADLRGADVSQANLSGANLVGANLTGARHTGAIFALAITGGCTGCP